MGFYFQGVSLYKYIIIYCLEMELLESWETINNAQRILWIKTNLLHDLRVLKERFENKMSYLKQKQKLQLKLFHSQWKSRGIKSKIKNIEIMSFDLITCYAGVKN